METLENRSLLAGFNFADFSNIAGLNLEGVAAITSDNRLRLTPAIGGQVGAAWYSAEKEFVTGNFSTTFQFQLANNFDSPGGSDGFTFAIQNTSPTYVAGGGGNLAYNGLLNSLVVEFDTFQNSEFGDTSQSSISVHSNGTGPNNANESYSLGHFDTNTIMDDTNLHTAKISYQAGSLSIFLDNLTTPKLVVPVDIGDKLALADGKAWVGFTGATGGGWQTHDILNWNFNVSSIPTTLVSIGDVAQTEGDSATSSFVFTLTRVGNLSGTTTVNWATANGTAAATSDYTAAAGLITFNPLETIKTISVTVKGDTTPEQNEAFSVKLSNIVGASLTDGIGTGTILNDEVTITISDATMTEGAVGAAAAGYFVAPDAYGVGATRTLLRGPDGNFYLASHDSNSVKVFSPSGQFINDLGTGGGELVGPWGMTFGPDGRLYVGGRYSHNVVRFDVNTGAYDQLVNTAASGNLVMPRSLAFGPDGNLYVSSRVEGLLTTVDAIKRYEANTGAFLGDFVIAGSGGLNNPYGIAFGPDSNLYVASASTNEIKRYNGLSGAFIDTFIAAGSGGLTNASQILFHTEGSLYVANQSTQQILRYDGSTGSFLGVFASNLGISPTGLAFASSGELYVSLGTGARVSGSAVVRLAPGYVAANVTLSAPSTKMVTVNYGTVTGTATDGADYIATSGTLTFAPGVTTQPILVKVLDDIVLESNEAFGIRLAVPSTSATIARADGVVTIQDDEVLRQISISDATATEGSTAGHYRGPFVQVQSPAAVSLPTFGPDGNLYVVPGNGGIDRYNGVTSAFIDHFLVPGTINGGARDIVFRDGYVYVGEEYSDDVLRFNAGSGAFDRTFVTAGSGGIDGPHGLTFGPDANGDGVPELYVSGRNSFNVVRYDGVTGAPLGSYVTSGSGGLSLPEGLTFDPSGTFLYVASVGSNQVLKYNAQTGAYISVANNTALTAPKDVNFGPDGLLYVPADNRIARFTASGTYVDDFVPAGSGGMSQLSRIAFGPNGDLFATTSGPSSDRLYWFGTESEAVFTASLPVASLSPISFSFTTADGTAASGTDYTATNGTLTFSPFSNTVTFRVPLLDDAVYEGNESFFVDLSTPIGGTIADGQGVGTIFDNELPPTKFYVVNDSSSDRTYEYGASGIAVKNYSINGGNSAPRGAASTVAGTTVWVVDVNRNVYVYNTSGALLGSWTAGSMSTSAQPEGITTNGTDVWIVDNKNDQVFKYAGAASRLSGSQNAASTFSLNSSNTSPKDLVTDGTSIWVVNDSSTDKVFKYSIGGTLLGSWTINAGGGSPTGITLDPSNASPSLWIVDSNSDIVYEYANARSLISGSQTASVTFALASGNTNAQGIADPPPLSALSTASNSVAANKTPVVTKDIAMEGTGAVPMPWSAVPPSSVSSASLPRVEMMHRISITDDVMSSLGRTSSQMRSVSTIPVQKAAVVPRLATVPSDSDALEMHDEHINALIDLLAVDLSR